MNFRGRLVKSGDADYNSARRVWNGMIDKHPAIIAYCSDKDDVINSVNFARSHDILVSVRSGGHNIAGNAVCDNGIVIDLSRMKKVVIDAQSKTATAQAGLTLGELDNATQAYGMAVPVGIVSKTGMAGLALGGGIGWLVRKHGLTCDSLLSAEVVTVDGQLRTASAGENPDLFWGIRGGGGNFGIVTEFTFRLHPLKQVMGGMVIYPADNAFEVFRLYRDYIAAAPDDLTTMLALLPAPAPFLSKRIMNVPLVAVHVCYSGPLDKGEQILKPLRHLGEPVQDMISIIPFQEMQSMLDAGAPPGLMNYWKSSYLKDLQDDCINEVLLYFSAVPSPLTQIHIQHLQGAMGRVREDETAFSHRNALCVLNIVSKWIDPAGNEKNIQWTRDLSRALEPYAAGAYVNFMGDEGQDIVRAAYSPGNYNRLVQLKNKYDPTNFFSLNQNIKPET
ncbi:MAG: FAD-binding oxidoreductase [Nitrospiraceae bacterium]|nr:MAG: FAD-binding oxidoreductase [Nitrospiraceae bacterium]